MNILGCPFCEIYNLLPKRLSVNRYMGGHGHTHIDDGSHNIT